ncbi:hypothetical protein A3L22_28885 [Streptomyces griseus subsp. griseus]|nr:hypothetical protein A3L22_28885 [Streptomyces griseus subsp. griseus]
MAQRSAALGYMPSRATLALATFSSASRCAASVSRRSVSSARSAVMRAARLRTAAAGRAVAQSRSSYTALETGGGASMVSVAGVVVTGVSPVSGMRGRRAVRVSGSVSRPRMSRSSVRSCLSREWGGGDPGRSSELLGGGGAQGEGLGFEDFSVIGEHGSGRLASESEFQHALAGGGLLRSDRLLPPPSYGSERVGTSSSSRRARAWSRTVGGAVRAVCRCSRRRSGQCGWW